MSIISIEFVKGEIDVLAQSFSAPLAHGTSKRYCVPGSEVEEVGDNSLRTRCRHCGRPLYKVKFVTGIYSNDWNYNGDYKPECRGYKERRDE